MGSSGGEGVIWRTADGGLSYQKALLGPGTITTVSVLGQADAWVATACPDGSPATCQPSLFHSSDGGRTWEAIAEVDLESISFVSPADGWAVGALYPPGLGAEDGKLLRTTDAGRHWQAVAENVCPGGWWSPRAVSFADARHGWVGCRGVVGAGMGPRAIAATADGGTTWHLVAATSPPGGLELGRISISGYLTGIAMRPSGVGLYWADRGVTEKTLDGGRTWTASQPSGFDTTIVLSSWLVDDSDWYALVWDWGAGVTTPEVLEASVDAGRTWRIVSRLPLPTP